MYTLTSFYQMESLLIQAARTIEVEHVALENLGNTVYRHSIFELAREIAIRMRLKDERYVG